MSIVILITLIFGIVTGVFAGNTIDGIFVEKMSK